MGVLVVAGGQSHLFRETKVLVAMAKVHGWHGEDKKKRAGEHFVGEEKAALESKLTSAHRNQMPHL